MDYENHANLIAMAPQEHGHKVYLFLDFADTHEVSEVPDPYYGGERGFEQVLDLVEAASQGLLAEIRGKHL
jgi:protein-tyrosine phosphatase